jgi:ribokinase
LSRELLEAVTWITPNESETRQLLAIDLGDNPSQDATAMAEAILGMGPKNVVLKMGRNGCYVASELPHLRFHNDAYPVAAIDTTAAGDAFNGAFATALLHEWDVQSATRFASATAAISVTRYGAQPSMPTFLEVTEFLRERGSDVNAWASDCSDHGEITGSTALKKETR